MVRCWLNWSLNIGGQFQQPVDKLQQQQQIYDRTIDELTECDRGRGSSIHLV